MSESPPSPEPSTSTRATSVGVSCGLLGSTDTTFRMRPVRRSATSALSPRAIRPPVVSMQVATTAGSGSMHGPVGRAPGVGGCLGGLGSAGLTVGSGVNGLEAESSNRAQPASRTEPSAKLRATRPATTKLMVQTLRKHRPSRPSRVGCCRPKPRKLTRRCLQTARRRPQRHRVLSRERVCERTINTVRLARAGTEHG